LALIYFIVLSLHIIATYTFCKSYRTMRYHKKIPLLLRSNATCRFWHNW